MAFKRIIGVLTVRDGCVVKSYGYASWRPAGRLTTALRNLDRWGADEIVVLDISRRAGLDAALLRQIADARIATPLAYGGGLREPSDLTRLMDAGCDRFVIESVLLDRPDTVHRFAEIVGRQALIGSLPVQVEASGHVALWRPASAPSLNLEGRIETLRASPVSEFLITDVRAEGSAGAFDPAWPDRLPWLPTGAAIWFGGLDATLATRCLPHVSTAAVAFGNRLHETELALPALRRTILAGARESIRPMRLIHP